MGVKLLVFGYVSSLLMISIGIISVLLSEKLIQTFVSSSIKLIPSTELYSNWLNPPSEVHMNFYLFSLKNGEDFVKNGAKPVFEEFGPFVYKEIICKEDIVDNLNYTISYKQIRKYTFVPELSPYNESFTITTLNMAPVSVISQIQYKMGLIHSIINRLLQLTGETILVTKTVREILFGYEDRFLTLLSDIDKSLVPTNIVGFFTGKNYTIDGIYTIYTGEDDYQKVGTVERYNYQDKLSFWQTPYANMINGTDATIYPPFIDKSKTIYVFENDLCRSLYLNYNHSMYIDDHIELYGFNSNAYFFANYTINPDNAGFCSPAGNCLPSGLLNLTTCLEGIPIIMSCPHFLYVDDRIVQEVDGIVPDLEKHQTILYVEPLTGFLMKANKRVQFNTQLIKDPRITIAQNLSEILFPLFWIDENFSIDKNSADKFYNQVKIPVGIINIGKYVVLGLGLSILLLCLGITYSIWYKDSQYVNNQNVNINWDANSNINETTHLLIE